MSVYSRVDQSMRFTRERPRRAGVYEHMKIFACNWRDLAHPRSGGAEIYVSAVAREWVAMGHDVTLFCAAVKGEPESEILSGVKIVRRGGRATVYREARRYWNRQAEHGADLVVDCINTRPFLTPRFVGSTPVVAIIHQVANEVWNFETPWPISTIGRHLLEPHWLREYSAVPVVAVSESTRQSLETYGLQRVCVVPEGWDSQHVPDARNAKEAEPTIIFVGRLSPNKRPEHVLRMFETVSKSVPSAKLWIVGDGPLRKSLERRAPERVTFCGRVSEHEKLARMQRAHVLVATSVREGWGLVVTEAAAMGTPTIAYDVPGLRDSVSHSGGRLTPANPDSLGRAVARALTGRDQLPTPASPSLPSWRVVARRILEVCEPWLGSPPLDETNGAA